MIVMRMMTTMMTMMMTTEREIDLEDIYDANYHRSRSGSEIFEDEVP